MKSNKIPVLTTGLTFLAAALLHAGPYDNAAIGFGPGQSLDVKKLLVEAQKVHVSDEPKFIIAGLIAPGTYSGPHQAVEWVSIKGGKFTMGTDNGYGTERP